MKKITIVIPVYNEINTLPVLIFRLQALLDKNICTLNFLFVDDGSTDGSRSFLENFVLENKDFTCIVLSRNFGHQAAISAGLYNINPLTDAVMIIDADLQDPPEMIEDFMQKLNEGYDVVYGIRKKRKGSLIKRALYFLFYRVQKRFSTHTMPMDAGDFSLISKRVVDCINAMPEESRYLRGIRTWVGFKQTGIHYTREEREYDISKYSYKSLFKLGFDGIFNFSELPVRIIGSIGFFSILFSFIYLCIVFYKKVFYNTVPEGFTTLIFAIIFFSGIQLFSLSIIGQYVIRIFFQVKQRPLFIIDKIIKNKSSADG